MNACLLSRAALVVAAFGSLTIPALADTPRTAKGRIKPYGSTEKFPGVPEVESPPLEFKFDPAGGMIAGVFDGESRYNLRRKPDVFEPLLVCVKANGSFRAFFDPKTKAVRGNVTFGSWNVTCYALDEDGRGTVDTTKWTSDLVRRLGYSKPPQDATFFGDLIPESGKGRGGIGAEKSFYVQWEVTFPADGQPEAAWGAPTSNPPSPTVPSAQPPNLVEETGYEFVMQTNEMRYVSGQRLTIACGLTCFQRPVGSQDPSQRRLVRDVIDFRAKFAFRFPTGDPVVITVLRNSMHRGGDNRLWFAPMAPAVPGTYEIEAKIENMQIDGELLSPPEPPMAKVRFECSPAPPPDPARVQKILDEFVRRISEHRAEVAVRHRQDWLEIRDQMAHNLGVNAEYACRDEPKLADADYGPYNNMVFHENGYQCSGYVDKTVRFLNRMRFYDPDPRLFVGLNYGPLLRGAEYNIVGPVDLTIDPHRAVALYTSDDGDPRLGWRKDYQRVLDPWPEQRPKVYTIRQFRLMYGQYDELDPIPDPEWRDPAYVNRSGFPTHGSCVYWNLDWEQTPAVYLDPSGKHRIESTRPIGIALFSPVVPLVRDAAGRQLGKSDDGRQLREIVGADLFQVPVAKDHSHWFIALPQGDYRLDLRGTGAGYVHVITGVARGPRYFQAAAVVPGGVVQLNVAADRLGQPLRLADGREVPAVRVDPQASAGGGAETEGEAIAALRRVGGVLINRDDRRAGRPVISVDFTNRRQIPPSAFRYLRAFTNLTSVALGGTDAGDEAAKLLEQVPHLEYLALDGTAITEDAIDSLLRMSGPAGFKWRLVTACPVMRIVP